VAALMDSSWAGHADLGEDVRQPWGRAAELPQVFGLDGGECLRDIGGGVIRAMRAAPTSSRSVRCSWSGECLREIRDQEVAFYHRVEEGVEHGPLAQAHRLTTKVCDANLCARQPNWGSW
jgi:hypothetical protein